MGLLDDEVLVYLDAWGLRRLFSLALRRRSSARKFRDDLTESLFSFMVECWGHCKTKKKGAKGQDLDEIEAAAEQAAVDETLASEAECGEDLMGVQLRKAVTDDYMTMSPQPDEKVLSPAPEAKKDDVESVPSMTPASKPGLTDAMDMDLDEEERRLIEQLALLRRLGLAWLGLAWHALYCMYILCIVQL